MHKFFYFFLCKYPNNNLLHMPPKNDFLFDTLTKTSFNFVIWKNAITWTPKKVLAKEKNILE